MYYFLYLKLLIIFFISNYNTENIEVIIGNDKLIFESTEYNIYECEKCLINNKFCIYSMYVNGKCLLISHNIYSRGLFYKSIEDVGLCPKELYLNPYIKDSKTYYTCIKRAKNNENYVFEINGCEHYL